MPNGSGSQKWRQNALADRLKIFFLECEPSRVVVPDHMTRPAALVAAPIPDDWDKIITSYRKPSR
jgi:hypothetical protein